MKSTKKSKPTCKTGIKKKVIPAAVFKHELELCRIDSRKNNGKCNWGKCEECGVIPLLYKLYKGQLLEDPVDIKKIKKEVIE